MHTDSISRLKHQGLWASSSFGRSEMGLESLLRACEDHEQITIIVDEEIPGGGQSGLEKWCLKKGAAKVTFKVGKDDNFTSDPKLIRRTIQESMDMADND